MLLEDEELLALIQLAQANLNRISERFILEKEQEKLDVEETLAEIYRPKETPRSGMMTPEQAQEILKKRAG